LDDKTGDAIQLFCLGDPRHSGENCRAFLERQGLSSEELLVTWKDYVGKRGSSEFHCEAETELALKRLKVDEDALPCLALFTPLSRAPILLSFPHACRRTEEQRTALGKLLSEALSAGMIQKVVDGLPEKTAGQMHGALKAYLLEIRRKVESLSVPDRGDDEPEDAGLSAATSIALSEDGATLIIDGKVIDIGKGSTGAAALRKVRAAYPEWCPFQGSDRGSLGRALRRLLKERDDSHHIKKAIAWEKHSVYRFRREPRPFPPPR